MSTETSTPEARVRRALAALELAAIRHRRAARRTLRVGEEELSALLYLAHNGGVTQRRLGEDTALSRSGAGAMVQRLEERGFVLRSTDATDRRLRVVELSPSGRALLTAAYDAFSVAVGELLSGRPEAELDALAELVGEIAGAAGAPDEDTAAPLSSTGEPIWRRWG